MYGAGRVVRALLVGQEEPERISLLEELDSIEFFLWEMNRSSAALHENRGPDSQCVLVLPSGSWSVCRVGRCQLDAGLPGKQLCHKEGQEVVRNKRSHH